MIGDTKKYNDNGDIIAFRRGVTFTADERPYKLPLHEYVFEMDTDEEGDGFYSNSETIHAIDAQTAWNFFREQYRVELLKDGLYMYECTVTLTEIDSNAL